MSQQPSGSSPVPGPSNLGDKFETYADFLESILDKRPEYRALYLYLKASQEQSFDSLYSHGDRGIDVVDIKSDKTVTAPIRVWGLQGIPSKSPTELDKVKEDC
ncbi:hypothetical protein H2201_006917 [Coniosporium apollinis]|uniref:Uncharacterized protein n=1 Tax=Coniosporium apollinis TaxID=61459 RepID=A0ABQ9NMX6_9PEZI|nr:hypothetical protein H2201_006917 [Coniosporium apollinis]